MERGSHRHKARFLECRPVAQPGAVACQRDLRVHQVVGNPVAGLPLTIVRLVVVADDQKRNAEDTSNRYGYQSSAGVLTRIESTSITPATIYPGDRVDLKATYALMAPQSDARITVTEIREIRFNGELVGKPEVSATHIPGTYDSNVPLFLANDAKRGTYQVITTIKTPEGSDARETSFTVR